MGTSWDHPTPGSMIREVLVQFSEVSVTQVASSEFRSVLNKWLRFRILIFCIHWWCRALKSDKHHAKYWQTTHLL